MERSWQKGEQWNSHSVSQWACGFRNVVSSGCQHRQNVWWVISLQILSSQTWLQKQKHPIHAHVCERGHTHTHTWYTDNKVISWQLFLISSNLLRIWMRLLIFLTFFADHFPALPNKYMFADSGYAGPKYLDVTHLSCWMLDTRRRSSSRFTVAGSWTALQPWMESPLALRNSGKPLDCLWPVDASLPWLVYGLLNNVVIWVYEKWTIGVTIWLKRSLWNFADRQELLIVSKRLINVSDAS